MHEQPAPRRASLDEIPVIDMTPLRTGADLTGLAAQIRKAETTLGFYYALNHGVPQQVIDDASAAATRFFAQPEEVRMRIGKDRFHRGYLPLGTTKHTGAKASLKDSFDLGLDLPLDDPDVVAGTPLHGPNQWPDLPGFRSAVEAYFEAVKAFGLDLLRPLALSLGLAETFFVDLYRKPTISMRMIRYPEPAEYEHQDFGIAAQAHTDYGLLTVLAQDPGGGLELELPGGEWVSAPYVPGTFVVNSGDLMTRWTNGVYRSNPHRVVNRLGRERLSIPFFFNPDHRALVQAIPSCVTPGNPVRHPPVLAGDYVTGRMVENQGYRPPAAA